MFKGVFGSLFDHDRNGRLDANELAGEMMYLDKMREEEEAARRASEEAWEERWKSIEEDLDQPSTSDWRSGSDSSGLYSSANSAFSNIESSLWDDDEDLDDLDWDDDSDWDDDNSDWDTDDPYEDAQENTVLTVSVEFEKSEWDVLDEIKRENYKNERSYDAAYYLCKLEHGLADIRSDTSKEKEIEKCKFILDGNCVAARYLTIESGFLFSQAVKENFQLPVEIPDEDDWVKTRFYELFMEVAEEDVTLAVDMWAWCVKEFGPYMEYADRDWDLYNAIIGDREEYPKEFLEVAIKRLSSDEAFRDGLLIKNRDLSCGIADFVVRALELELITEAQTIFTDAVRNPNLSGKELEEIVDCIIQGVTSYEELETMERFKYEILPLVEKIDNKRIQRLLPDFCVRVNEHIEYVERVAEKYQYTRRYAWRANCADGTAYDIDPLDYDTEEAYNKAIYKEKYGWRSTCFEARRYGLNVEDYETEEEYEKALFAKEEEERKNREPRKTAQTVALDPKAQTDKTVYNFCTVMFGNGAKLYSYLTGGADIKIGDQVIVPIGSNGMEIIATVVSTSQHMRLTAPYPVDKAKTILKKVTVLEDNH